MSSIKSVALLLGNQSGFETGRDDAAMERQFSFVDFENLAIFGNGNYLNPLPPELEQLTKHVTSPDRSPCLLFAALNGRSGSRGINESRERQPHQIASERYDETTSLLKTIAQEARKTGTPVEIFMLTAQRPDFIHSYARQMPRGSVIVAAKTAADTGGGETFLNFMAVQGKPYDLSARGMLVSYLLSGEHMRVLPEIAVSGKPRQHLKDVWHQMVRQGGISAQAETELRQFQRALPDQGIVFARSHIVFDAIERSIALTTRPYPDAPKNQGAKVGYAAALLTMWDKMFKLEHGAELQTRQKVFQPKHSTGSVSANAAKTVIVSDVRSTGSARPASRRLNADALAALPKGLRKAAIVAPGVFSRALRRH